MMKRPKAPHKEAIMLSTKVRGKSPETMKQMRLLAVLIVPAVALIMGAVTPEVWAQPEISEFEVFFEFNSTDLDLGFDIFLDADPWVEATLTAPDNVTQYFFVNTGGGLEEKGNTEIMTESAEPPFCEDVAEEVCDEDFIQGKIDEFQDGFFPEGDWTIEVLFVDLVTTDTATVTLSHALPAAPKIKWPREGFSLRRIKSIRWKDKSEEGDPEIISYEAVAEMVIAEDDEERTFKNTAILPGSAKKLTIPKEFMKLAKRAKSRGDLVEFKVEVIGRGENLNKTITEVPVFEFEEEE
jgi:hypothetical protein